MSVMVHVRIWLTDYIVQNPEVRWRSRPTQKQRGEGERSGQGKNERYDIVTRAESTPERK